MASPFEQPNALGAARSPRASTLIAKIVAADERRDAAGFVEVLTPDASFRFGSAPPTNGRDAVRTLVGALFSQVVALEHTIYGSWEAASDLVYEGRVHYTFADATSVAVPYVNVLRLDTVLVCDYRIYIDPTPLLRTPLAAVLGRSG